MKHIIKLFTLLAALLLTTGFVSCSSDDEPKEQSLAVTPANLNGVWKMTAWNNGQPMPEGTYCYVVFHRRDNTMEMYDNLNSMYAVHTTGSFKVEQDPYLGYVVSGSYDYNLGDWNQSYIVTNLYASGSMIWTAKDDASDVCRYERCDAVPSDIIKEASDIEQ
ncbi:MAG: lipocalin family protein [Prevotella sp.]|nr:lipocalin family protein [Prevotella sp.]